MDPFNLSRYANLTVQRVQPPEEKPLPKAIENEEEEEEDYSDEEDDFSGSEEDTNKAPVMPQTVADAERSDIHIAVDDNIEVKLKLEHIENESENESKNKEQTDEEIEANSKRKSGQEEDDQTPKKAKMNEESMYILFWSYKFIINLNFYLETSDEDPDNLTTSEKRPTNLRRNIREVMDETKLDESTLAAQRQEMERLQRVQEQQRLIRDVCKI